jgi:hypothetical protein
MDILGDWLMKKSLMLLLILGLMMAGSTQAGVYYYHPSPTDLRDLDHFQYASWGINWTHQSERIVEATLTFSNIWNWRAEPNNLYTHLLDYAPLGTQYHADNTSGDQFLGQGNLVGNWTDSVGGRPRNYDLIYRFSTLGLVNTLNTYSSDGRFGFGFDADCHYYNDGVTLAITTSDNPPPDSSVPEPASMLLFGVGVAGASVVRKLRK